MQHLASSSVVQAVQGSVRGRHTAVKLSQRLGAAVRSAMQRMQGVYATMAPSWDDNNRIEVVRNSATLASKAKPLERALLERIHSQAQFVLIGEASHGTDDFYRMRAELTKLLIAERGFNAVVVEADFPNAFRLNMYVRGLGSDKTAQEALGDFKRFPTWMWKNTTVAAFIEWLRQHNEGLPLERRYRDGAGFLGMDLYSLHESAHRVIEFLQKVDPDAAKRAKARYQCFDRFGADTMAYGYAVGVGGQPSCAEAALANLREVSRRAGAYSHKVDGELGEELAFAAHCNAAVVKGAEGYYRNMFFGDELTWNLRDSHFLDTCKLILGHLSRRTQHPPRLVVWAHNSHLGDARATDMGQRRGELNIGQLMRQEFGMERVYNVGVTTHTGTVAAADDWDTPVQLKAVRKGMPGSYEHLFHKAEMPEFALDLRHGSEDLRAALAGPLLERAIGVIYRPRTERQSHYFGCSLPAQFDFVVHLDETSAVKPLERTGAWEHDLEAREDAPDTYPFAV